MSASSQANGNHVPIVPFRRTHQAYCSHGSLLSPSLVILESFLRHGPLSLNTV